VSVFAAEKEAKDLKNENMRLKMELNKANLLFKGKKLPNYIDSQLRKRRDNFNKSFHDLQSLDRTAISWAFDPKVQL